MKDAELNKSAWNFDDCLNSSGARNITMY